MNPLTAAFATGVRFRNALYDRGILRVSRLQGPVISVGNLSVGGSGKTPFVILLAELLKARGIEFDILTRGYGRTGDEIEIVDPQGSARDFGDEPLLLARRLGVPVIVGPDRYKAGLIAERRFGSRLHLLDDGFQHRRLARDFDVVLVSPDDLHDRPLPSGRLREPIESLRRAHAIVLPDNAPNLESWIPGSAIAWRVRRGIEFDKIPVRPIAFCGIARPPRFFRQLHEAGITPVAEKTFPDHHAYSARDVAALIAQREKLLAEGFVATEKDVINLGRLADRLSPLGVVRVSMELLDAEAAMNATLDIVSTRRIV
jgi:tetraacyldisaccharide 4'-kinase